MGSVSPGAKAAADLQHYYGPLLIEAKKVVRVQLPFIVIKSKVIVGHVHIDRSTTTVSQPAIEPDSTATEHHHVVFNESSANDDR